MKEKIQTALKTKFPNIKLSQKRLDAIAEKIEAKTGDDETKIDAALDALNDAYPLAELAKDDHARASLEGKVKALQTKKEEETAEQKTAREATEALAEVDKDTPPYIKKMMEKLESVSTELAVIKGEKVANTIKSKVTESLKEKNIPVDFWDEWKLPEKEEDLPAFTEKVTAKYSKIQQGNVDAGLGVLGQPKGGVQTNGSKTKATDKEIEAVISNIM